MATPTTEQIQKLMQKLEVEWPDRGIVPQLWTAVPGKERIYLNRPNFSKGVGYIDLNTLRAVVPASFEASTQAIIRSVLP